MTSLTVLSPVLIQRAVVSNGLIQLKAYFTVDRGGTESEVWVLRDFFRELVFPVLSGSERLSCPGGVDSFLYVVYNRFGRVSCFILQSFLHIGEALCADSVGHFWQIVSGFSWMDLFLMQNGRVEKKWEEFVTMVTPTCCMWERRNLEISSGVFRFYENETPTKKPRNKQRWVQMKRMSEEFLNWVLLSWDWCTLRNFLRSECLFPPSSLASMAVWENWRQYCFVEGIRVIDFGWVHFLLFFINLF